MIIKTKDLHEFIVDMELGKFDDKRKRPNFHSRKKWEPVEAESNQLTYVNPRSKEYLVVIKA